MEIRVADHHGHQDARGRTAGAPSEIPKRGWKDILWRVKEQVSEDNLSMIAAGVAFFGFLAIFPSIAAMVSLAGMLVNPADVESYFAAASNVLPPDALTLLQQQVHEVVSTSSTALGWGFVVSLGLALWSAAAGMKALMLALNIAYEEKETRGMIRYYGMSLLLTLGGIIFAIVALALVALLPPLLDRLPIPQFVATLLGLLRWVILAGAFVLALAVVYRFGPSREKPRWRWVSWGAVVATALWLIGSVLFSVYVSNFGDYNKTYGALAAIVILLTWFYLTAFVVLLGAELNAEIEHQTAIDSTTGQPQPMGQRGARMADSVGRGR